MIEFFKNLGGFIMKPLYFLISAVLLGWHQLFGNIFGPASGAAWALSIIGLTLVIRAALIPLFVKQIKSQRNLQLLQPKVKELQKKYGHDRELLGKETMKLYKDTGTNPFSSCLPLIVQMPIFIGLFRLLDLAAKKGEGRGLLTDTQAQQFADAELFGAPISATFKDANGDLHVMILAGCLVLAMTLHDVPDPASADQEGDAEERPGGADGPAAEDHDLGAAPRLRHQRCVLPDRRTHLLDHLEPVDHGPAVLRDPEQPRAEHRGVQGQGAARRGEAQAQG